MKPIVIACLVLVCGACSKQGRPQVTVVVHGVGEYVLDDKKQSCTALHHALRDKYDRQKRSPVLIRPADGTSKELVRKAIDICVANGEEKCISARVR
jgi:biopolymer transport protein ExbD